MVLFELVTEGKAVARTESQGNLSGNEWVAETVTVAEGGVGCERRHKSPHRRGETS